MSHLVACSNEIKVWNLSGSGLQLFSECNPHLVEEHPELSGASCVRWNLNNKVVASCGKDGCVYLTKDDGTPFSRLAPELEPGQMPESLNSLCWGQGSRYVCTASSSGLIRAWKLEAREVVRTYKGHTDAATCVAFSNTEEHIVSGSASGDILIHQAANGVLQNTLRHKNRQPVRWLDFSPTQKHDFASVCDAGSVYLWDFSSRREVATFQSTHAAPATCAAWSPTVQSVIASCGLDKRIQVLDGVQKRPAKTISTEAPLQSITFHEEGNILAVGTVTGKILTYDLRAGSAPLSSVQAFSGPVNSAHFQRLVRGKATAPKKPTSTSAQPSLGRLSLSGQPSDDTSTSTNRRLSLSSDFSQSSVLAPPQVPPTPSPVPTAAFELSTPAPTPLAPTLAPPPVVTVPTVPQQVPLVAAQTPAPLLPAMEAPSFSASSAFSTPSISRSLEVPSSVGAPPSTQPPQDTVRSGLKDLQDRLQRAKAGAGLPLSATAPALAGSATAPVPPSSRSISDIMKKYLPAAAQQPPAQPPSDQPPPHSTFPAFSPAVPPQQTPVSVPTAPAVSITRPADPPPLVQRTTMPPPSSVKPQTPPHDGRKAPMSVADFDKRMKDLQDRMTALSPQHPPQQTSLTSSMRTADPMQDLRGRFGQSHVPQPSSPTHQSPPHAQQPVAQPMPAVSLELSNNTAFGSHFLAPPPAQTLVDQSEQQDSLPTTGNNFTDSMEIERSQPEAGPVVGENTPPKYAPPKPTIPPVSLHSPSFSPPGLSALLQIAVPTTPSEAVGSGSAAIETPPLRGDAKKKLDDKVLSYKIGAIGEKESDAQSTILRNLVEEVVLAAERRLADRTQAVHAQLLRHETTMEQYLEEILTELRALRAENKELREENSRLRHLY